jgi:tryptophanase
MRKQKLPMEFHKPMFVQKVNLLNIDRRLEAIKKADFNTFQLSTQDIFLDMLTDSGTNAMSTNQLSAMMTADQAYSGSQSFDKLKEAVEWFFGAKHFLPVHQGRAAEHILSKTFVKPGKVVLTNFHFTTSRGHVELVGGRMIECCGEETFNLQSDNPFKGNMNINDFKAAIDKHGVENIAFVRMEVTTNLTGGQPVSMKNLKEVRKICDEKGLMLIIDACLVAENAFFIKEREPEFKDKSLHEIILEISEMGDIIYFSARKLGASRGGGIATNNKELAEKMENLVLAFEGFLTYGGMSTFEMEALAVGLKEFTDIDMVSQMPSFIEFAVNELDKSGIPVVTPPGALGFHLDARAFLPQIEDLEYPAGTLAAALFIAAGTRGMERGTISTDRDPDTGDEIIADVELVRVAMPRRVFSLSQLSFLIERIKWLHKKRDIITSGLKITKEPEMLRFFTCIMEATSNWPAKLVAQFKKDFDVVR